MPSVAALLQKPLKERSEAEMRFLYQHKERTRLGPHDYELMHAFQRRTIERFEAALAIYTELDDRTGQALMLQDLGKYYKERRYFAKAKELFQRSLAVQRLPPSFLVYQADPTNSHRLHGVNFANDVLAPLLQNTPRQSFPRLRVFFANNVSRKLFHNTPLQSVRRLRVLTLYPAPEQSAFCWGAVPCPLTATSLAPWVQSRMAHIRSMDYPLMQQQMLDFVDMVVDLSAQQRRKKRPYSHIDSNNPELWSLFQVASECRRSVEFWLVFSTVLDYFGAC